MINGFEVGNKKYSPMQESEVLFTEELEFKKSRRIPLYIVLLGLILIPIIVIGGLLINYKYTGTNPLDFLMPEYSYQITEVPTKQENFVIYGEIIDKETGRIFATDNDKIEFVANSNNMELELEFKSGNISFFDTMFLDNLTIGQRYAINMDFTEKDNTQIISYRIVE